jgi:pimeloyl-ACP methyl ester carboxylesterase
MPTIVQTSHYITAPDGLRLHAREWRPRRTTLLPVFCLPGLARTVADFESLAVALVSVSDRAVWALDSRGRGKSEYDRDPRNYTLAVELADLLAVLTALGVNRAIFIGTSRGGILTMLLATTRPTALAGCVLNDIGPVIEAEGLVRIRSYVGKLPPPADWADGAEILRKVFASQFPKLDDAAWLAFARRTFKQAGEHLMPDYDVALRTILDGIDLERPIPALWKEFEALSRIPLLVIRGTHSDILSRQVVKDMQARHPGLQMIEEPDQGHAPLLEDAAVIGEIARFIEACGA